MFDRVQYIAGILLLSGFAFSLKAEMPCVSNGVFRDEDDIQKYISKTAIFGSSDTRQTEEEYANSHNLPVDQLKASIAATGNLDCKNMHGTANLTGKADVIATAGHFLYDFKSCKHLADATDCVFTVKIGGKSQKYLVGALADTGFRCPNPPSPNEDWAVMTLKKPVKGVIPYDVAQDPNAAIQAKQKVVATAAFSADFFRIDRTGAKFQPKQVGDCYIHKVYSVEAPIYFSADCSTSYGGSGGAILNKSSERPLLLGVLSSISETDAKEEEALKTGKLNKKPFDENTWAGYYIPVAGEFLEAINKAAE